MDVSELAKGTKLWEVAVFAAYGLFTYKTIEAYRKNQQKVDDFIYKDIINPVKRVFGLEKKLF